VCVQRWIAFARAAGAEPPTGGPPERAVVPFSTSRGVGASGCSDGTESGSLRSRLASVLHESQQRPGSPGWVRFASVEARSGATASRRAPWQANAGHVVRRAWRSCWLLGRWRALACRRGRSACLLGQRGRLGRPPLRRRDRPVSAGIAVPEADVGPGARRVGRSPELAARLRRRRARTSPPPAVDRPPPPPRRREQRIRNRG
jgi:hypothetical protein